MRCASRTDSGRCGMSGKSPVTANGDKRAARCRRRQRHVIAVRRTEPETVLLTLLSGRTSRAIAEAFGVREETVAPLSGAGSSPRAEWWRRHSQRRTQSGRSPSCVVAPSFPPRLRLLGLLQPIGYVHIAGLVASCISYHSTTALRTRLAIASGSRANRAPRQHGTPGSR